MAVSLLFQLFSSLGVSGRGEGVGKTEEGRARTRDRVHAFPFAQRKRCPLNDGLTTALSAVHPWWIESFLSGNDPSH